jgi:hypothetical protein
VRVHVGDPTKQICNLALAITSLTTFIGNDPTPLYYAKWTNSQTALVKPCGDRIQKTPSTDGVSTRLKLAALMRQVHSPCR